MFPLTLDRIKAAYQKTGITPARSIWYGPVTPCACPAAVCYLADAEDMEAAKLSLYKPAGIRRTLAESLGVSLNVLDAFTCGVDGSLCSDLNDEEREAYEAGRQAALQLFA